MEETNKYIVARIDWLIVIIYVAIVLFGLLNIYAASYNPEHPQLLSLSERYGKQVIWIVAAVVFVIIPILVVDVRFFPAFSYYIYGLAILSLLGVIAVGKAVHGSLSWFDLGFFRFQPAEFAKFATLLALSRWMSQYNFKLMQPRNLAITLAIIAAPALLILLQPDFGSAFVYSAFIIVLYREGLFTWIVLLIIQFALLFLLALFYGANIYLIISVILLYLFVFYIVKGSRKKLLIYLLLIALLSVLIYYIFNFTDKKITLSNVIIISASIASVIIIFISLFEKSTIIVGGLMILSLLFTFSADFFYNNLKEHQKKRIDIFLGKVEDPKNTGYNVLQAKIAIGSGGLSGKGFLQGTQTRYKFVPEQYTDFIFCPVGEEYGFIGTTGLLLAYLILIIRIILRAEKQRSTFSRVYGYGVASILFLHVAVNVSMTIGLFPVIGIPLPFMSYGGSSLIGFTILLFIFVKLDTQRNDIL